MANDSVDNIRLKLFSIAGVIVWLSYECLPQVHRNFSIFYKNRYERLNFKIWKFPSFLWFISDFKLCLLIRAGVGASGTPVPMGTRVPAGTHRNFENLSTAGYRVREIWEIGYRRVPGTVQILEVGYRWVPGTGQKRNLGYRWVPGTVKEKCFGYRWVPGIRQKKNLGTDGYRKNFHLCRPLD